MFKKIGATFLAAAMMTVYTPSAWAAPFNSTNNPNIVANYPSGSHGIVGEDSLHTGADLVVAAGQSGNFQQWFVGNGDGNVNDEGDHSVWLSVGNSTSCPSGWDLLVNAQNNWGSYLKPGNYCVHTNNFQTNTPTP